jgi:translation initiation factor 3 subunit C
LLDRIPDALDILISNPDLIVADEITDENEQFDEAPYQIRGCVLTIVERLDEEFVKLLKECDPHSNEYVQRYAGFLGVLNRFNKFFFAG